MDYSILLNNLKNNLKNKSVLWISQKLDWFEKEGLVVQENNAPMFMSKLSQCVNEIINDNDAYYFTIIKDLEFLTKYGDIYLDENELFFLKKDNSNNGSTMLTAENFKDEFVNFFSNNFNFDNPEICFSSQSITKNKDIMCLLFKERMIRDKEKVISLIASFNDKYENNGFDYNSEFAKKLELEFFNNKMKKDNLNKLSYIFNNNKKIIDKYGQFFSVNEISNFYLDFIEKFGLNKDTFCMPYILSIVFFNLDKNKEDTLNKIENLIVGFLEENNVNEPKFLNALCYITKKVKSNQYMINFKNKIGSIVRENESIFKNNLKFENYKNLNMYLNDYLLSKKEFNFEINEEIMRVISVPEQKINSLCHISISKKMLESIEEACPEITILRSSNCLFFKLNSFEIRNKNEFIYIICQLFKDYSVNNTVNIQIWREFILSEKMSKQNKYKNQLSRKKI